MPVRSTLVLSTAIQTLPAMHTALRPLNSASHAASALGLRSRAAASSRIGPPSRLAGLTLWSWLVLLGLGALFLVTGARCLPVLLEYQGVTKAAHRATRAATVAEARAEFDRVALVEGVRSVQGTDLAIEGSAAGLRVRFAYQREIPLVGSAYLVFKLSGDAP